MLTPVVPKLSTVLARDGYSCVPVSAGGTGVGSLTGLLKGNGTAPMSAATASDIPTPLTTLGDILYRDGSGAARLPGNITAAKRWLSQTGAGASSNAPVWDAIATSDLPSLPQSQITNLVADLAAKANDSAVVHVTGNETVTGPKGFAGQVSFGAAVGQKAARIQFAAPPDGTIAGTTVANASTTITGSGTAYLTDLGIGDRISLSSAPGTYATVTAIASNTSLTVSAALGNGTTQTIAYKRAIARYDTAAGAPAVLVNDVGGVALGIAAINAAGGVEANGIMAASLRSDLVRDTNGNIYFQLSGTAPGRTMTIGNGSVQSYVWSGRSGLGALTATIASTWVAPAAGMSPLAAQGIAGQTAPLIPLLGRSSTTDGRSMGSITAVWTDGIGTDASRLADIVFSSDGYNGPHEAMRWRDTGSISQPIIPLANIRDAADDTAAAALSPAVPVGGLYRTGSTIKIRTS